MGVGGGRDTPGKDDVVSETSGVGNIPCELEAGQVY